MDQEPPVSSSESNPEVPPPRPIPKTRGIGKFQMIFYIVMALGLGAVVGFFVFWYTMGSTAEVSQNKASPEPTASASPTPTAQPSSVVDPASSDNIIVTAPLRGDAVQSPITVAGKARVFESALSIRLKDASGKVLVTQAVTTKAGEVGQFSDFQSSLPYLKPVAGAQGTVEVFTKSAQNGSEEDLIQIPVVFK